MRNGATCMFSGLTTAKQPITPSMWGWVLLKVTVLLEKLTLHKQWTEAPSNTQANMCPCVRLIHPDNQTAGTNQYVTGYIFNTIYFGKLFIHYLENIDKPVILIFLSLCVTSFRRQISCYEVHKVTLLPHQLILRFLPQNKLMTDRTETRGGKHFDFPSQIVWKSKPVLQDTPSLHQQYSDSFSLNAVFADCVWTLSSVEMTFAVIHLFPVAATFQPYQQVYPVFSVV